MSDVGTAYINIALKPGATQGIADEMAAELRRLADYLDAYSKPTTVLQPSERDETA